MTKKTGSQFSVGLATDQCWLSPDKLVIIECLLIYPSTWWCHKIVLLEMDWSLDKQKTRTDFGTATNHKGISTTIILISPIWEGILGLQPPPVQKMVSTVIPASHFASLLHVIARMSRNCTYVYYTKIDKYAYIYMYYLILYIYILYILLYIYICIHIHIICYMLYM